MAAGALFGQLSTLEALMLGSTVAATDAAAIFAVLRGSTLRRKIARTLEGESGINDPIAVLLVLGCIEALDDPSYGVVDAILQAVRELSIGFAIGLAVAGAAVLFLRRVRLPSAGLYPVASIATGALAFGAAQSLHGSGFLAVFLAGLVLGTASTPARRTITTFHEGLAWVAQLGLFLTLGLLVFPDRLDDVALKGAAIAIVTAVFARPLAAVIATVFSGFSVRERLMLGWAGLRGATPIVFATFPVTAGSPTAQLIFDVAFFVVLLSTVLQGTTIEPVARWLGVTSEEAALPAPLVEPVLLNRLGAEVVQFPVATTDAVVGHPVRELGLPREALLNVIVRGERAIPPRGSTIIEAGDQLHMIVRQEVAVEFQDVMRMWRAGPLEAHKRPRPRVLSRPAVTSVRPWTDADGDPSRPAAVSGQRSSTSCARAATSRARWWRWPTGASRSPAGCSRSARRGAAGRGAPAPGARGDRRRPRLVAGGRRRARPLAERAPASPRWRRRDRTRRASRTSSGARSSPCWGSCRGAGRCPARCGRRR